MYVSYNVWESQCEGVGLYGSCIVLEWLFDGLVLCGSCVA